MINSFQTTNSDIGELVRKAEQNYTTGTTNISKYVEFNLFETLNKVDAYLNSKHISGETDALGREKPFFNIVTAAVNIWQRATDIDRKDIVIKPTKAKDTIISFLANVHLQNWMKRENFGVFLNDWGRTLARYGSAVSKFVETDGNLHCLVVPWNRLIIDAIDFENNPKIEILELTPAQLKQRKGYDQKLVDKLIETHTARENADKQKKDNQDDYIKLYEIHGELPLSFLTGKDKDKNEYAQQMHIISFVENKGEGKFDDYTLISGRENKDPYRIDHLIKEDGRSLAIGAVEHLFEAQWMLNHTTKQIKDQLDLASKLIFQTSDGNFVGQNALSAIENGDILTHAVNQPLTELSNTSHDIASLQAFGSQWKVLAQEITGTPDVMMGNNMPSGTAYRQAAIIQQEAHSNFELMTENKGLAIEGMLRNFIIPHLKKKMDTKEEISTTLEMNGIEKIDELFIRNEAVKRANYKIVQAVIDGEMPTTDDQNQIMTGEKMKMKEALAQMGNHRFYVPDDIDSASWKEILKDLEWEVETNVSGESGNKEMIMTTLTTMLQTIATNPMILQDPNAKMIFNKILNESGVVSPAEIQNAQSQPQQQQLTPPAQQAQAVMQ